MSTPDIVNLIISLSPTEKQYFKKSNASDSDFVHLFDYINKFKTYNSEKVKAYLIKKNATTKSKKYTSGHLSVLKNYLHEKIMESLRSQYIPKRTSYNLVTRVINTDILLEKGLYRMAKNEIESAKKKSGKSNFPIEKLMLFRRESLIQFYEDYAHTTLQDIHDLYEKRISAGEQLILEIKYARILSILSYQYFKGEKDEALLLSFIHENHIQDESLPTEFVTKYLFHWVHAQIAEFQNKPEKAIHSFEKSVLIWLDHPEYIKAHSRMYLGVCKTYLKYILQQKKSYKLILKDKDFKEILSKIPTLKLEKEVEAKTNQLFLVAQLLANRLNKDYDLIIQHSSKVLTSLEELKTTNIFTKVMTNYIIALAYFKKSNFKKAASLLQDLIYNDSIHLNANPEYHSHVFKLFGMTLYELKNFKFLRKEINRIKKFRKHLIEKKFFDEFETLLLNMIAQLISPRYSQNLDDVFARFYPQLIAVAKENELDENIEYQFILEWTQLNAVNAS
ncbi:MAG: hypothetical protein AB8H03_02885 [Saprospiraceae bacterium]